MIQIIINDPEMDYLLKITDSLLIKLKQKVS